MKRTIIARLRAIGLTHVSIPAVDVDEALRFYREVFGMEQIPAPNFGFPVRWLRLGDLQLHLYHVDAQAPHTNQHLGLEVDDFEAAYRKLKQLGLFEHGTQLALLWELPSGEVQMYFRDPDDNLIEVNHPDVSTLDRDVFGDELRLLEDRAPQSDENRRARLFLQKRGSDVRGRLDSSVR